MRLVLQIPFAPSWAFVELGVWPLSQGAKFLLCIGEWVHMGHCEGRWWLDNLQRRKPPGYSPMQQVRADYVHPDDLDWGE